MNLNQLISLTLVLIGSMWQVALSGNPAADDFINDEKENKKVSKMFKYLSNTFRYNAHPSHRRNVKVYSNTGHFLAIYKDGSVQGTLNINAPEAVLELQSFGVSYRRMKSKDGFYLGINKHGVIKAMKKPNEDTLFKETVENNGWYHYESEKYDYVLAMKKNGKVRNRLTSKKAKKHTKKCQFLVMYAEQG